jgi:hypothetical protein
VVNRYAYIAASTLAVKYREQFGETPSDTLRRSEVAQSSR